MFDNVGFLLKITPILQLFIWVSFNSNHEIAFEKMKYGFTKK